jgi:hypothetical protein
MARGRKRVSQDLAAVLKKLKVYVEEHHATQTPFQRKLVRDIVHEMTEVGVRQIQEVWAGKWDLPEPGAATRRSGQKHKTTAACRRAPAERASAPAEAPLAACDGLTERPSTRLKYSVVVGR